MIRKGELGPYERRLWTEVPYVDEAGMCRPCGGVRHQPSSAIGQDHATAVIWRSKQAMTTMSEVMTEFRREIEDGS